MTIRTRTAAAATAVVAALALAACGTSTPTGQGKPAASQGTPAAGPAAPATLTALDGTQVRLPADKPTAVFFFSVGCGECVGGARSLAQAARTAGQAGSKAGFLAVDLDPSESDQVVRDFLRSIDAASLPTAIDRAATVAATFQVTALSALIVVDPAGKVTYRATDPAPDKILAALTRDGAT